MNNSLEFKIAMLIKEINSKITLKITEELKSIGFTAPQITAIKFIAHHKELTVSELSEKMCITKATMSGILDRLEKMDIVERIRSKDDKRVVYVKFSKEGLKMAAKIKVIMNNSFENIFKNVEKEKLEIIEKQLIQLLNLIDDGLK